MIGSWNLHWGCPLTSEGNWWCINVITWLWINLWSINNTLGMWPKWGYHRLSLFAKGWFVRHLAVRIGERISISSLINKVKRRNDSTVCYHLLNCKFSPSFKCFIVLCHENKKYILKLKESLFIMYMKHTIQFSTLYYMWELKFYEDRVYKPPHPSLYAMQFMYVKRLLHTKY